MQHDNVVLMHFSGDDSPDYSDDYAPYASPAEFTQKMRLVLSLLDDCVRVSNDGATAQRAGVEPGSPAEREARRALVGLLRASWWEGCGDRVWECAQEIYGFLTHRLDPDNEADPFELTLSRRYGQKGPVSSDSYDRAITSYILSRAAHGQMKAAISHAMEYFGISREKAYGALRKYRHEYESRAKAYNAWKEYQQAYGKDAAAPPPLDNPIRPE